MRPFHKALLHTGIAVFITAFLLSKALLVIYSLWHMDSLIIPRPDKCLVIEGKGRTVFSSFVPWHIYYTLKAINTRPIGEVITLAWYENTTFLVRGLSKEGLWAYGINADLPGRGKALIGVKLAERLGLSVGDKIKVKSIVGKEGKFEIIGVVHSAFYPTLDYELITSLKDAMDLLGVRGLNIVVLCNRDYARLINEEFHVRIEGNGYEALILNAVNETVKRVETPWEGILPFGLYRVLAFKGKTPCFYEEVLIGKNRTIFIPKNTCVIVKPGKGNVVIRVNGVRGEVWVLAVNGGKAFVTRGSNGEAVLRLKDGVYLIVVYSQGAFAAVKTFVRGNTTIVVRPKPIRQGVLVLPGHVGGGTAILSRVLRDLFSLALAFLSSLTLSIAIGIVSLTRFILGLVRSYVSFLRLNRASPLTIFLLVDLGIIVVMAFSCVLAFYAAYTSTPLLLEAFNVRIFEKPLYLVISTMSTYDMALFITVVMSFHLVFYVACRLTGD